MQIEAERTYLEITDPERLRPFEIAGGTARIERMDHCPPSFFRYLYREVGRRYHWTDRLGWTDERIRTYLGDPGLSIWLLSSGGSPAGYFELLRGEDGSTEVAYFGVLPEFTGRGLGKHLLTFAIRKAFEEGARRVWLHTCTLDHPSALGNYIARGLKPFRTEKYLTTVCEDPGINCRCATVLSESLPRLEPSEPA